MCLMVYKNKNITKIKKYGSRISLTALLILCLFVVAAVSFNHRNKAKDSALAATPPTSNTKNPSVNLSPPTPEEVKSGDETKKDIIANEQTTQPSTSPQNVPVQPLLTYAGVYNDQVEVGAYVPGIFEEGGICTLTLTKDGKSKSTTVTAVRNVNSVDCPVMTVPRSELTAGTWRAVVGYKSVKHIGESSVKEIEVK